MIFVLCLFLLLITGNAFLKKSSKTSITTLQGIAGKNQKIIIEGTEICYDLLKAKDSNRPTIAYLPGLIRQKNDAKSINLQSMCKRSDINFVCADYIGVGRSGGKFSDGSITKWAGDSISLLSSILPKGEKAVLVGHGVGAWISLVIASKRPDLVSGIVGLAADPDFTEELLWKTLSEELKQCIMEKGECEITWGNEKYPISKNLIEDGRKNLLLTGQPGSIPVTCPVRLIHGIADEEVPFSLALKLVDNLATKDASVVLLKKSTHAMDTEEDFQTMRSMLREVIEARDGDFDLRSPGSG